MNHMKWMTAGLLSVSAFASAQDVVLSGYVQRVTLQPHGVDGCPPPCASLPPKPDGSAWVCVSNSGGCQSMLVKVEHVYRGTVQGDTREFKTSIGEWGPSFQPAKSLIVVSEEARNVYWSVATEQDGKLIVNPQRLGRFGGKDIPVKARPEQASLDELLAASGKGR